MVCFDDGGAWNLSRSRCCRFGGALGDPPVGAAATGSGQTSTRTWGEEHSTSTPADPASGPPGAPPAGKAGGKGEPPPPPPPLPPGSPRIQEDTEAIGVGELNDGRAVDQPIFDSMSRMSRSELHDQEREVKMYAAETEWVLYMRSCLRTLTDLEELEDVASLASDPPRATAEVYMDLVLKCTELASEQSGRPVGAPILREWVNALGDQWKYVEPPINPGPSWSEVINGSKVLEVPYRSAVSSDSALHLGDLPFREVQGDEMMQKTTGKKHNKNCATPGAAIRSWTKGRFETEAFTIHDGAQC